MFTLWHIKRTALAGQQDKPDDKVRSTVKAALPPFSIDLC
jgi:hypothetical protein